MRSASNKGGVYQNQVQSGGMVQRKVKTLEHPPQIPEIPRVYIVFGVAGPDKSMSSGYSLDAEFNSA